MHIVEIAVEEHVALRFYRSSVWDMSWLLISSYPRFSLSSRDIACGSPFSAQEDDIPKESQVKNSLGLSRIHLTTQGAATDLHDSLFTRQATLHEHFYI